MDKYSQDKVDVYIQIFLPNEYFNVVITNSLVLRNFYRNPKDE